MSFFGIQNSEQKNIVDNNISSSVNNSNSNIAETTFVNTQHAYNKASLVVGDYAHVINCGVNVVASADLDLKQDISMVSKTNTTFDTGLTTNVTNELKNKVKEETPGLFQAGMFSSQVNNQLNQSVNTVKNDIFNDFYIKRSTLLNNTQISDNTATFTIGEGATWDCGPGVPPPKLEVTASSIQRQQSNFLSNTIDDASAKSTISTILTNDLKNVADLKGGDAGGIILGIGFIIFWSFAGAVWKGEKSKGKDAGAGFTIPPKIKVFIIFLLSIVLIVISWIILNDDDNYEKSDEWKCEEEKGFFLKDKFKEGTSTYDENLVNICKDKKKRLREWGDLRVSADFSITDTTGSIDTNNQYPRRAKSTSLRGTISEVDDSTGTLIDIDYTKLNLDPYSSVTCGEDGLDSITKRPKLDELGKTACRTIEQDFKWEELIKNACGCCKCDPSRIGYYDEWISAPGQNNQCFLDDSRPLGVQCDKGIDIIQPGAGYDTGADYLTRCRDKDGGQCKKKEGEQIVVLEDGDPDNLTVRLISDTDCHGENDALPDDDDDAGGLPGTGECYNSKPAGFRLSNVTESLFGSNTGVPCTDDSWLGDAERSADICPSNCVKGDSCRIDYLKAMDTEGQAARGGSDPRDIESQKAVCAAPCIYKVHGVREIKIDAVPENHISNPDYIYTIERDRTGVPPPDLHPWLYTGISPTSIESVWSASSLVHYSNGTNSAYALDKYSKQNDDQCSAVPTRSFPNDNINEATNICECKFRRLPSCIKDEHDNYTSTPGCPDSIASSKTEGDCMTCINDSGVLKESVNDTKLTDDAWNLLAGILGVYIGLNSIILFII
jgi:hypothetical protein